jgi:hypothetical protein
MAGAYVARPSAADAAPSDELATQLEAAALLSLQSGPLVSTVKDPGPVLEVLAVDPVVRAMRAEQIALASRRLAPQDLSLPEGLADMHPTVAAKTAQALHALALPPFVTAPAPAASPNWWRRTGRLFKRRPVATSAPSAFVASAIQEASGVTGVSAAYLQGAARRESAFNPFAQATTSSATGLFQFVEATWLDQIRLNGARYGYAREAASIRRDARGRFVIADPAMRAHVLSLRLDPQLASLMAGHLTRSNAAALQDATGRPATAGDLYVAHVLGVDGAVSLMRAAVATPDLPARDVLPRAAAANRKLFYRGSVALSSRTTYLLLRLKGEVA